MPTADEIKAKIEEANRQHKEMLANMEGELDRLLKAEVDAVIAQMKADIKKYMIRAKDLGFLAKTKKPKKGGTKVPPKATHPTDGRTWSGRGTKPTWVRELENSKTII